MKTTQTIRSTVALVALVLVTALSGCASAPLGQVPATTFPSSALTGPGTASGTTSSLPVNSVPPISLPVGADAALRISVRAAPEAAEKISTLVCSGNKPLDGSSLADPAAACATLQKSGPSVFAPPASNRECTMQFGGPQTARVSGTFDGTAVEKSFSLQNGCEIADWNSFAAVLGGAAGNGL